MTVPLTAAVARALDDIAELLASGHATTITLSTYLKSTIFDAVMVGDGAVYPTRFRRGGSVAASVSRLPPRGRGAACRRSVPPTQKSDTESSLDQAVSSAGQMLTVKASFIESLVMRNMALHNVASFGRRGGVGAGGERGCFNAANL